MDYTLVLTNQDGYESTDLQSLRGRSILLIASYTVYPKKYAHGFCFAVLSNDCPSASKATLMNMDKYFMWIHYERLRNHNKAKHNKTVCIFLGIHYSFTPGYEIQRIIVVYYGNK